MKNCHNILLIAGTGRNVGKTLLACEIINHFSKKTAVIGVKISSHQHPIGPGQKIIANTNHFQVIEESLITNKDSSRMVQAGAFKAFYIQSGHNNLEGAFQTIEPELIGNAVICESGGLHQFIKPGIFFLVSENTIPENKKHFLNYNPVIVNSVNGIPDFDMDSVQYYANIFTLISKNK